VESDLAGAFGQDMVRAIAGYVTNVKVRRTQNGSYPANNKTRH